jgi:4-amino-4-deoxy-L-arabinose transferase-like glycosyltransferase
MPLQLIPFIGTRSISRSRQMVFLQMNYKESFRVYFYFYLLRYETVAYDRRPTVAFAVDIFILPSGPWAGAVALDRGSTGRRAEAKFDAPQPDAPRLDAEAIPNPFVRHSEVNERREGGRAKRPFLVAAEEFPQFVRYFCVAVGRSLVQDIPRTEIQHWCHFFLPWPYSMPNELSVGEVSGGCAELLTS